MKYPIPLFSVFLALFSAIPGWADLPEQAEFSKTLEQQILQARETVSACAESDDDWRFKEIAVELSPYWNFTIPGAIELQVGPSFHLIWQKDE